MLGGITYCDADSNAFTEGIIHSQESVIPGELREQTLQNASNYVEVARERVTNTFILSSWVPSVRRNQSFADLRMLVSYNLKAGVKEELKLHTKGVVKNMRAHPHL